MSRTETTVLDHINNPSQSDLLYTYNQLSSHLTEIRSRFETLRAQGTAAARDFEPIYDQLRNLRPNLSSGQVTADYSQISSILDQAHDVAMGIHRELRLANVVPNTLIGKMITLGQHIRQLADILQRTASTTATTSQTGGSMLAQDPTNAPGQIPLAPEPGLSRSQTAPPGDFMIPAGFQGQYIDEVNVRGQSEAHLGDEIYIDFDSNFPPERTPNLPFNPNARIIRTMTFDGNARGQAGNRYTIGGRPQSRVPQQEWHNERQTERITPRTAQPMPEPVRHEYRRRTDGAIIPEENNRNVYSHEDYDDQPPGYSRRDPRGR